MRYVSNRSHANVNRVGHYNAVDAKLDHPHSPMREIALIVRAARLGQTYRPPQPGPAAAARMPAPPPPLRTRIRRPA